MKIDAVKTFTPKAHKMIKTGVAMAAGIAIGLGACSAIKPRQNQQADQVVIKGHEFNSLNDLKEQGKTKHLFAAQDGPDKGSRYYNSSDYDFFGNYKN
jgi:hypothetical protein